MGEGVWWPAGLCQLDCLTSSSPLLLQQIRNTPPGSIYLFVTENSKMVQSVPEKCQHDQWSAEDKERNLYNNSLVNSGPARMQTKLCRGMCLFAGSHSSSVCSKLQVSLIVCLLKALQMSKCRAPHRFCNTNIQMSKLLAQQISLS